MCKVRPVTGTTSITTKVMILTKSISDKSWMISKGTRFDVISFFLWENACRSYEGQFHSFKWNFFFLFSTHIDFWKHFTSKDNKIRYQKKKSTIREIF